MIMSEIFISYARADMDRVKPIVKALDSLGLSIFWDCSSIPVGKNWRQLIKEAINEAKCVLVLWSNKSIDSEWVIEEADHGKNNRILVPVRIDDVHPPIGFGQIQAANLIGWTGDINNSEFYKLVKAIESILGSSPIYTKEVEIQSERKRKQKQEKEQWGKEEKQIKVEEEWKEEEAKRARKAQSGRIVEPVKPLPASTLITQAPNNDRPHKHLRQKLITKKATDKNRIIKYSILITLFVLIVAGTIFIYQKTSMTSRTDTLSHSIKQDKQIMPTSEDYRSVEVEHRVPLFIDTEPKYAKIRVLNIKPKFHQGIRLPIGQYHIEISAKNYETKKQWIELAVGKSNLFLYPL
jgi:hypothetical protein